jgi:hypothetical protein
MKGSPVAYLFAPCLLALACSSEPAEFADWTIDVPEGTPVVEYQNVTGWDRGGEIELVRDVVIQERGDDLNYVFANPRGLAVDAQGRIYILDTGNSRVQVFDENGDYLRTLGQRGQGPGELDRPMMLAVAGDRVAIADRNNSKLSLWTTGGEHLEDLRLDWRQLKLDLFEGLPDGSFLLQYNPASVTDPTYVVARWSPEGVEEHRYVERSLKRGIGRKGVKKTPSGALMGGMLFPVPIPWVATSAGDYYLTWADEYQVLAFDESHEVRWALRVAAAKRPFTEDYVDSSIEFMRQMYPETSSSDFESWRPDYFPVLERIYADGHGHLYVVPFQAFEPEPPPDDTQVDVYSSDGSRLFTGWMPNVEWEAALGDFVYAFEKDPKTRERIPVRYRLVEPS